MVISLPCFMDWKPLTVWLWMHKQHSLRKLNRWGRLTEYMFSTLQGYYSLTILCDSWLNLYFSWNTSLYFLYVTATFPPANLSFYSIPFSDWFCFPAQEVPSARSSKIIQTTRKCAFETSWAEIRFTTTASYQATLWRSESMWSRKQTIPSTNKWRVTTERVGNWKPWRRACRGKHISER